MSKTTWSRLRTGGTPATAYRSTHSIATRENQPRRCSTTSTYWSFDLQDVGTRVYTYVYTMANCLRGAQTHGVPVVVCDRPNPIGGTVIEGPVLQSGYESFVGQFPIPLRHGMTIGELARLFNEQFGIGAALTVSGLEGWARATYQDEAGVPWVMPSPNLPTLDSAVVYPGTVLVEGTNLSEGRGTTRPFELIGAPWIDGEAISDELNRMSLPGVLFRAVQFKPTFQKHAGQPCGGCQIHVTDRRAFMPVLTTVALLQTCRRSGPEPFRWRSPPYEYEEIKPPIDRALRVGPSTDAARTRTSPRPEIAADWAAEVTAFEELRVQYLLY